ncbi:hypothetical protein LE190_01045 [Massilia oculi]|uniref:Suppressor of fused-like domain-containing protein n=1 Tax=Massilia hydrophila TaxID=3044279 RepID=A0ABS7Y856_9BURK|nr:hypothetical protein [Massilia oculi]MCA1854514.1 hypothetical protein [Massilia oculi]
MNKHYSPALAQKMAGLLAEQGHFGASGDILSWEDQSDRRQYTVVYPCEFDDMARLIFTLPTITRNIYVTVSDGDAVLVRRVLGTAESQELEAGIVPGNVLLLDDPRLAAHGIRGVIFLLSNLFNCLDNLPAAIACDGETYPVLSVAFLTGEEHRIWKEAGHDALMDHWAAAGKDLIAFGRA